MSTTEEIVSEVASLSSDQQRQVLDYVRAIKGDNDDQNDVRVEDLLPFAGLISTDDLREMERVIEEEFEQVDEDAWK